MHKTFLVVHVLYVCQKPLTSWFACVCSLYRSNKEVFDFMDNVVLVFGFPFLSISAVIVATSIIIQKLNKALR